MRTFESRGIKSRSIELEGTEDQKLQHSGREFGKEPGKLPGKLSKIYQGSLTASWLDCFFDF